MRTQIPPWTGVLMALCLLACSSQPENLSGTWHLNPEKSSWAGARKPLSVVVMVDHQDPSLSYHGTVAYENEESRPFGFIGAIDGKEYPISRSFGPGKIVIHREGSRSWVSLCRSDDGQFEEKVRTILSRSNQVLTRQMTLRGPRGSNSWTEVYEKR